MVVALLSSLIVRVAGELPPCRRQVISSVLLRRNPQGPHRLENGLRLPGHVVVPPDGEKGKVQISQVVVDRPTTGQTADKMSAVCFQCLNPALVGCVLIAPDHHGALVLPQVQDTLPRLYPLQEIGLQGQIFIGICALCGNGI